MKELKRLKEKTERLYDTDTLLGLRMKNTYVLRWLFRTNIIKTFSDVRIINTLDERLVVSVNKNEYKVELELGDEPISDITALVKGSNKYGSAIFKRFFKYYSRDLLDEVITSKAYLTEMVVDEFREFIKNKDSVIFDNLKGEKVKIIGGVIVIEEIGNDGCTIIDSNPSMDKIYNFANYLNPKIVFDNKHDKKDKIPDGFKEFIMRNFTHRV